MNGEEKVRILAWRRENVTTKKFAYVLRGQGHLWWFCWLLHVTYLKMPFFLPNLDLDNLPKTTKHTDDLLRRELRNNRHFSASGLKEMHPDHLGNVSVRCIQHSLQKELNIPNRHAASKTQLIPHMRN